MNLGLTLRFVVSGLFDQPVVDGQFPLIGAHIPGNPLQQLRGRGVHRRLGGGQLSGAEGVGRDDVHDFIAVRIVVAVRRVQPENLGEIRADIRVRPLHLVQAQLQIRQIHGSLPPLADGGGQPPIGGQQPGVPAQLPCAVIIRRVQRRQGPAQRLVGRHLGGGRRDGAVPSVTRSPVGRSWRWRRAFFSLWGPPWRR